MGKISIKLKNFNDNEQIFSIKEEAIIEDFLESNKELFQSLAKIEELEKKQEVIERIVEVEKLIEVPVEKIIEKMIYVDKIIEVPVEIEKIVHIDKPIHIDRIVERIVEVEKVVEKPYEIVRLQFQKFIPKYIYGIILLEAIIIGILLIK